MGQASSVQREPSMEEILASIRRIIEDSDVSRKGQNEPGAFTPAGDRTAEPADIAAFRTGLHEQSRLETAVSEDPEQFGAASGYHPAADRSASAALTAEPSPAAGFSFSTPASLRSEQAVPQPADEIEMELDIESFEEAAAQDDANSGDDEPLGDLRQSILSETTGRQVAASFGELSDALAARSRKSYDQIAEEMLRPMLQDWLDNNLPHLVEKLVREEIERIARGPAPR